MSKPKPRLIVLIMVCQHIKSELSECVCVLDIGVDNMTANVPQRKRYNNKYYDLAFRYIDIYDFYFWATKILIFIFLPSLIL